MEPIGNNLRGVPHGRLVRGVWPDIRVGQLTDLNVDQDDLTSKIETALNEESWWPGDVVTAAMLRDRSIGRQMVSWLESQELGPIRTEEEMLLCCEGATFHTDSFGFPSVFFCIAWLEDRTDWDLVFPASGHRVELKKGTVVLFDSANVHGVVARGTSIFDETKLGDVGVQALYSMSVSLTSTLMKAVGLNWLDRGESSLNLSWSNEVQPRTGLLA